MLLCEGFVYSTIDAIKLGTLHNNFSGYPIF